MRVVRVPQLIKQEASKVKQLYKVHISVYNCLNTLGFLLPQFFHDR